jgi:hypothetical protein
MKYLTSKNSHLSHPRLGGASSSSNFREYLDKHGVIPLVREMVRDVLLDQPSDPLPFMVSWVQQKKNKK